MNIFLEYAIDQWEARWINNQFRSAKAGETVNMFMNTPGGDILAGFSIIDGMRRHDGPVNIHVTGLAASMGSVILAAATGTRSMAEGTRVMIHNPWTVTVGDSKNLKKTADLLEGYESDLLDVYESVLNLGRDEIQAMMDEETWLNPTKALEMGFVDEITQSQAAACVDFDLSVFDNVPADMLGNEPKNKTEENNMFFSNKTLKAELEKAEARIKELEEGGSDVTALQAENEELSNKLETVSGQHEATVADLAAANAKIDELKASQADFDKKVETAAAAKAQTILSSAGTDPVGETAEDTGVGVSAAEIKQELKACTDPKRRFVLNQKLIEMGE